VTSKYSNCRSRYCYALNMATYIPPGWPTGVHPPGSSDFEATAVAWLLDVVPPDYRLHGVLRRHPMALAAMARHHTTACVEGARQGYRTARTELAEALPPHAVDAVLTAYRTEGRRLAATARAVALVERAMHGEPFAPKLLRHQKPGLANVVLPRGPERPLRRKTDISMIYAVSNRTAGGGHDVSPGSRRGDKPLP
jgi:hypothetical protein